MATAKLTHLPFDIPDQVRQQWVNALERQTHPIFLAQFDGSTVQVLAVRGWIALILLNGEPHQVWLDRLRPAPGQMSPFAHELNVD
jgi:hypothetical protein